MLNTDHFALSTTILNYLAAAIFVLIVLGHPLAAAELTEEDAETLRKAEQAVNDGDHQAVIEPLQTLRKEYPDLGDIPRLLTHAYYELGQIEKARTAALKSLSLGRLTADVLVRLAQIDQQREDSVALTNTVRLLTVIDADSRQWRTIYGDLLANAEAFEESVIVFRKLIEERPDSAELHMRLGNVLMQQGRLNQAALTLETAWNLGSTNAQLPLTIAGVYQQLGRDRSAIAWIQHGLELQSDADESLKLQLARMLWTNNEAERARRLAEPLSESSDRQLAAEAHTLLGRMALARNDADAAMGHLQKAVQAGADSPQLLAMLGAHYYNAGEYAQAAEFLERAVMAEGGSVEQSLRFLILSLIQTKQRDRARDYLRQYIEHQGLSDKAKELIRILVVEDRGIRSSWMLPLHNYVIMAVGHREGLVLLD